MFSDTQFQRLLWKEYRQQRALWLAIAVLTPAIQGMLFLLIWMAHDYQTSSDLSVVGAFGYALGVLYLLACSGTMFSVEHEASTFDFQRILPANQPRVFWAKVVFAVGSGGAMMAWLWLVTRGVFLSGEHGIDWLNGYGLLYLAEVFAWGVLASLLIRNPLWSVIGAIVAQSMMQGVIPFLYGYDFFDMFIAVMYPKLVVGRLVWLAVLFAADVYVGKLWFEDRLRLPKWRVRKSSDFARPYLKDVELPRYRGERLPGWSRHLWLAWRDGRWLIGGVLLWFGCCWRPSPKIDQWHHLMTAYFVGSYLCGLFAFAPEQWQRRYLFCMERGCSPRRLWLCRQIVFLPPVLLMMLVSICLCWQHPQSFSKQVTQFEFEWASAIIGPLICYSAGQFAAMLFRRTAFALAAGCLLTFAGIMWSVTMTAWLAPAWWAIGAWPVIGLFVTWLRANDWAEERTDRVARWRLALGLGVPIVLLLATCATYRVVQIPVVTLPAEWGESDTPIPLTAAEAETLDIYRRALAEIEAVNKRVATFETRIQRTRQEHPDWSDDQRYRAAFDGFHKDWLTEQAVVVPLLREAHSRAAVPLALLQPDLASFSDEIWMPDKAAEFSLLMVKHARQLLEAGQLDEAWQEIEVTWELLRRYSLRAAPVHMMRQLETNESMLWSVIADWGRHPDQSSARIVSAIRRLEQLAGGCEAARHIIHRSLMTANLSLFSDQERRQDIHKMLFGSGQGIESTWLWNVWRIQPWERWRTRRVLRWRASVAVAQIQEVRQQLDANQLFVLGNWSTWDPAVQVLCETTVIPPSITWNMQVEAETNILSQTENFRATILQLALADWQRARGRYPELLSELTPTYFVEVPCDPRTARPIGYFPHGVPDDVTQDGDNSGRVKIEKGIPFLLTMGFGHVTSRSGQRSDGSWEFTDHNGQSISLSKALRSARVWPLEERSSSKE